MHVSNANALIERIKERSLLICNISNCYTIMWSNKNTQNIPVCQVQIIFYWRRNLILIIQAKYNIEIASQAKIYR